MRSSLWPTALLLGGCLVSTEIDRPIGIVIKDLDANDSANLQEAAQCWNLEFGTQFVAGAEASTLDQQVFAFYDDQTCLQGALAQVQTGWPMALAVCPER